MQKPLLIKTVYGLLLFVLITGILYFTKLLFMPLAMAAVLALVLMPLGDWLEKMGMRRLPASLICGLVFILFMSGILALLIWHVKNIAGDLSEVGQNVTGMMDRIQQYLHEKLGVAPSPQEKALLSPGQAAPGGMGKTVTLIMSASFSVIVNLLLIVVYTIMLLCQRHRFREFLLQWVPPDTQSQTKMILLRSTRVVQHYLFGLAIVILCLWIMYGIGFSAIGVKNAIFFAILCGLLEIVPFVGNLTGSTLTSVMAVSQGGGFHMVLSVLAVYALIQFIQFYIISPLVMRAQLNINPLFTIFILIAGELLWGVTGMILAIPFLGIAKVLFDNIKALQPLGYLIGREKRQAHPGWFSRWKTRIYKGMVS